MTVIQIKTPTLQIPLLFLAGGKDKMTRKKTLEKLARSAPEGQLHIVDDGSHFALIEAPDEVNRVLQDFFEAA